MVKKKISRKVYRISEKWRPRLVGLGWVEREKERGVVLET
jgi:hypothetical protein